MSVMSALFHNKHFRRLCAYIALRVVQVWAVLFTVSSMSFCDMGAITMEGMVARLIAGTFAFIISQKVIWEI